MKKIPIFLLTLFFFSPAAAQTPPFSDGMTEDDFMNQAQSDPRFENDMLERITLMDINDDGAISSTEKDEMIGGLSFLASMTEEEKTNTAAYVGQAFTESDADKDGRLSGDEIKRFARKLQLFLVRQQFHKMDINRDGVINEQDIPPVEESLKKLQEATEKLKAATEKLNAIPPKEMAGNFLKNVSASIAKEDFFQMDRNKNGCVTVDEYVDYQMAAQEKEPDDGFAPSRDIHVMLYNEIKKASPDCLKQDEYITHQANMLDMAVPD